VVSFKVPVSLFRTESRRSSYFGDGRRRVCTTRESRADWRTGLKRSSDPSCHPPATHTHTHTHVRTHTHTRTHKQGGATRLPNQRAACSVVVLVEDRGSIVSNGGREPCSLDHTGVVQAGAFLFLRRARLFIGLIALTIDQLIALQNACIVRGVYMQYISKWEVNTLIHLIIFALYSPVRPPDGPCQSPATVVIRSSTFTAHLGETMADTELRLWPVVRTQLHHHPPPPRPPVHHHHPPPCAQLLLRVAFLFFLRRSWPRVECGWPAGSLQSRPACCPFSQDLLPSFQASLGKVTR